MRVANRNLRTVAFYRDSTFARKVSTTKDGDPIVRWNTERGIPCPPSHKIISLFSQLSSELSATACEPTTSVHPKIQGLQAHPS